MFELNKKIYESIKQHSLEMFPEECCGLLTYDNKIGISVHPCKNVADDKRNNFVISPSDYLRTAKTGNILSFYHSHTLPDHSEDFTNLDKMNSVSHKLPIILYNCPNDQFKIFNSDRIDCEYVGFKFKYNEHDCYSLVEMFYSKELKIQLPKTDRDINTMENNPYFMAENIENYGFKEVEDKKNIQYGDIIMSNSLKGPTHLMIYIDNNQILHHRYNQYSTIEQYNNLYKSNTFKIIRHKKLWN
jgi:proteasome lid subunit RPN8/RPN11